MNISNAKEEFKSFEEWIGPLLKGLHQMWVSVTLSGRKFDPDLANIIGILNTICEQIQWIHAITDSDLLMIDDLKSLDQYDYDLIVDSVRSLIYHLRLSIRRINSFYKKKKDDAKISNLMLKHFLSFLITIEFHRPTFEQISAQKRNRRNQKRRERRKKKKRFLRDALTQAQ